MSACVGCGSEVTRPRAIYCTAKCRDATQWRRLHPVGEPRLRPCAVCGLEFRPKNNDVAAFRPKGAKTGRCAKYCSDPCRNRASKIARELRITDAERERERELRRAYIARNRARINQRKRAAYDPERQRDARAARDPEKVRAARSRWVRLGGGVRVQVDTLPGEWARVAELVQQTRREIRNRSAKA